MSKTLRRAAFRPACDTPPYSVSQNFLTSCRTINRLLRRTNINPEDTVLEIGAGKGHITRALAALGCRVLAVEIDPRLCDSLRETLLPFPNVTRIQGDFLKLPLPAVPYKVFANIPFSLTTAILQKLTESASRPPEEAWLIMEKGAAMRFCGRPAESRASLLLKPYFHAEIAGRIGREEFHPSPSVDASVLHLTRRTEPDLLPAERRQFAAFIDHVQRYGLFGPKRLLTKKQAATALRLAGLPSIEPSSAMKYVQWLCLFRCCRQFGQLPPPARFSSEPSFPSSAQSTQKCCNGKGGRRNIRR